MRFLRQLEQTLGRFAVPQVTLALIVVQVVTYLLVQTNPNSLEGLLLIPEAVFRGEVWRLATFLAVPPQIERTPLGPIWAFLFWYAFYLMGTALEQHWGVVRYNIFLSVGYLATVAASFVTPQAAASNLFLETSVLLAFAFLFPDFRFLIFFVLPIRVWWIALFTWLSLGFGFLVGGWPTRVMIFATITNFLLFFWRDLGDRVRHGRRRMSMQVAHMARAKEPAYRHRCATCGITDKTHPNAEFRYCSKCAGGLAYCGEHLRNHEHVVEPVFGEGDGPR